MSDRTPSPRTVPEEYATKLKAARAARAMQGERRVITILFCDVTGSTAMAEQLDPEEWAEIMNEAFDYMIAPIYRYEGTVARLMGDGFLAFFGAPITHEDDPARAVLAALEIVDNINIFGEDIGRDYGYRFDVRVGINTGQVVVGEIGHDLALEYTAMGDAVNLASRMETSAQPGTVQISANTFRLVAPLFEVEDRGLIQVKGKEEPVHAYRVLRQKPVPGRLRGLQGLHTPLVGRAEEMTTLRDAAVSVRQGRGQVVFLIGEAGLGKSRLIDELRREWLHEEGYEPGDPWPHWAQIGAVSYGASTPYGMIKYQLRQGCDIRETDPKDLVREKLATTIAFYPEPVRERMGQVYAILLGAGTAGTDLRPEGEDFKRELFAVMREATALQVGDRPTVYVADDLHWGDPASVEEILDVLQLVKTHPVLFICAMRPERSSPAWGAWQAAQAAYAGYLHTITLQPLSGDDSAGLVEQLLDIAALPRELVETILQKSEGNPFFIEEVVRTLLEDGLVAHDNGRLRWIAGVQDLEQLTVPDNVQALLIARIDRLEREARRTLQLAAVIGRSFYERVLKQIADTANQIDEQLERLEQLELILEAARTPEQEYQFRHALTRDAAYRTILHRQRRQFHRRVAEALEALFPDRLDDEAHRLAYHYEQAGDDRRALDYYILAGDVASRLYANVEAGKQYERALVLARRVGSDDQLYDLYTQRGRVLELCGEYGAALENYEALNRLGKESGDRRLELQGVVCQALLYATYTDRYEPSKARLLLQEALQLAEAVNDAEAQARVYWNLMVLEVYDGSNPREAVRLGEHAVAIAREHDLHEVLAYALHDLARPYTFVGDFEKGRAALEEAGVLWRELGNMPMLADNRATLATGLGYLGEFDSGLAMAEEALGISRAVRSYWGQAYTLTVVAYLHFEQGRFEKAIAAWEECLPLAKAANFTGPQIFTRVDLALAYGYLGLYERASAALDAAQRYADEEQRPHELLPMAGRAQLHTWRGDVKATVQTLADLGDHRELLRADPLAYQRVMMLDVHLCLERGDAELALARLDELIAFIERSGLKSALPELWALRAETLLALGETAQAVAQLTHARAVAERMGVRRQLWFILLVQAQVAASQGNGPDLAAARVALHNLLRELAAEFENEELRSSFLGTWDARASARLGAGWKPD